MDYQNILQTRLQSPPYYNHCSDCHNPGPTWCSVNFHVFLCTRCATLHKQYLHKSIIKSITLDRWLPTEIDMFCSMDPQLDQHIHMFCQTDNVYDLTNLIKNKYNNLEPLKPSLIGNRKATNYELSQFGNQIRLIQNISPQNQFYSIDLIVEALLLSNNNIDQTMSLLKDFTLQNNTLNTQPPQLPKRPERGIKSAIFDGSTIISNQSINNNNNNINSPRPAVFDGTVDFTQQQTVLLPQTQQQSTLPQQYTSFPQQTTFPQQALPAQQTAYSQNSTYSQNNIYSSNSAYPPYYNMANNYPPQ